MNEEIRKAKEALGRSKRRVPRRPIETKVGMLVAGRYSITNAWEIGEGGILVDSSVALTKGQKVVVTVRIPGALHAVLVGTVVYSDDKPEGDVRYGLQFDDVDFETRRKIRNFVASGTNYVVSGATAK